MSHSPRVIASDSKAISLSYSSLQAIHKQIIIQIFPIRVYRFNQFYFILAIASLQEFFICNSFLNVSIITIIDQLVAIVPCSKTFGVSFILMIPNTANYIGRDSCVKNCILLIGYDVNTTASLHNHNTNRLIVLKRLLRSSQ